MQVTGKIKTIVRDKPGRLTFFVNGQWLTLWMNATLDPEVKAAAEQLLEGQEVEFDVIQRPSKTGGKPFLNISGFMPIQQLKADFDFSKEDAKPPAQNEDGGSKPESNRMDARADATQKSICTSYAVTLICSLIQADKMSFLNPKSLVEQVNIISDGLTNHILGEEEKKDSIGE